jgi:diaminopimelate epimerase
LTRVTIRFTKMSGAGNDFVVIDDRDERLGVGPEGLARAVCPRRTSVGADGLIVVGPPNGDEDFSMRYYNADGSEADLCGNGARCVARFAHGLSFASRVMRFSSRAGLHGAEITDAGVSVTMPAPPAAPRAIEVPLGGERVGAFYVVVGVPHVVVFRRDVSAVDVAADGARIRRDGAAGPTGANVDFVQLLSGGRIRMRTYERGVEAETLACGTGAVASAVAACSRGVVSSPVEVETASGDTLTVHGADGAERYKDLALEGPAVVVYDGVYAYEVCEPRSESKPKE